MKEALRAVLDWFQNDPVGKFLRDVIEAGVAAAAVAVYGLNLDTTSPKTVILVAAFAFLTGAIALARRRLVPA